MESAKVKIKCKNCDGFYVVREGQYGTFGGCSTFPKCRSTIKLYQFVTEMLKMQGMNIYKWERICWKCKRTTNVYSYFLNYQLKQVESFPDDFLPMIGLGDIETLDEEMARQIPAITMSYSMTVGYNYMANTCKHCGAIQGKNFVVDDPHEILGELWYGGMEKYLYKTIYPQMTPELDNELKELFR